MLKTNGDSQLTAASQILEIIFTQGQTPLSDQFLRWRVWHNWVDIVGQRVSQYSIPVGFYKGTLLVWVKTPVHLQELSFVLESMKDRINNFIGYPWLKSVRLTVNRKQVPSLEESSPVFRDFFTR